jgi:cytochrome c oxidase subunit II
MTSKIKNIFGGLAAIIASLSPSLAFAEAGKAVDWQLGMQDSVTPVMDDIMSFHNMLLVIITVITVFVLALLLIVIFKFNSKANPVPSKTTHNTLIEVLWTVIPVLILVVIAVPSFRLLYKQRDIPAADMTIKVIGNPSWNWTYEYPDLGLNDDKTPKVTFTSYLKPKEQAEADGQPYLLSTDVPVLVPVNKVVKLIVTSDPEGIIHGWAVPSFGMQMDAIPGRLNEDWFKVTKAGIYYGECYTLCGKDHSQMPIEVWAVDDATLAKWADMVKAAPSAEDMQKFLKTIKPANPAVASN